MFESWGRVVYRRRRLVLVIALIGVAFAAVWGTRMRADQSHKVRPNNARSAALQCRKSGISSSCPASSLRRSDAIVAPNFSEIKLTASRSRKKSFENQRSPARVRALYG